MQTMWGWMTHIDSQRQVQRDDKPVFAKRALVSCRVPYVHPYLFYRFQVSRCYQGSSCTETGPQCGGLFILRCPPAVVYSICGGMSASPLPLCLWHRRN